MGAVRKLKLLPPSADNPRNSEGSIVELNDGRLYLVYSHFYGGRSDHSAACLAARFSEDRGESWTEEDTEVIGKEGRRNVMSVTLLRLASGELALFYLVKESTTDTKLYMRISEDEGKTWGERICTMPHEGYHVVNNDRVIQHSSGRILVPAAWYAIHRGPGICACFHSDDLGKTWEVSKNWVTSGNNRCLNYARHPNAMSGLQEPGIIELKDGSLMMLARCDMGCQFRSYSYDRGESWTVATTTEIMSPCSPATVKRIPKTGDLLLIWNDHSGRFDFHWGKRSPLCTAVSHDEGKSWKNVKMLEEDLDGWYCYTSCMFADEKAILSYCAGNERIGRLSLTQITLIDIDWLYS